MPAPSQSPAFLRAVGFFAAAVFLALVARFWHPAYGFTRFLQLDASNDDVKIAAFKAQPVYVYRNTGGYDGLYYAQIAYHPALAAAELAPAVDNLAYRAHRILPPALAWLLAAGQPAWIVQVYSLLNVAAWLALAAILWRLLPVADWRGWLAWAGMLFSAGALSSVRFALTDLVALALLSAALLSAEVPRPGPAAGLLAAAGLARETFLLALVALFRRPWLSGANLLRAALAIAPLAAWLAYVRWRVGPGDPGSWNFALPLSGFFGKWRDALATSWHPNPDHLLLTWASLLAMFALTVQAVFILRRPRLAEAWWRLGAIHVLLLLFLAPTVWDGFPGAATRVLLPLTLAFNVLVVRTRAGWGWLSAGNLAVFSGLLMMVDVHRDPREFTTARAGGIAMVAHSGDGWFDAERTARHTWIWSSGHGRVTLEAWPQVARELRLEGMLRSLAARTVTVTQDGAVLWRGAVGPDRTTLDFSFLVHDGRAELEFTANAPGEREKPVPGARMLAFAIYDPRLSLPDSIR